MIIQLNLLLTILLLISPSVFGAIFTSGLIGYSKGSLFNISSSNQTQQVLATYDVNGLNSIQLQFPYGKPSTTFGSLSGSVSLFSVPTGQYISKVLICIGSQSINSIEFITNKDIKSPVFGCPYSNQESTKCYSVSALGGLLGLQGYADSIVKGINFVSNQPITTVKTFTSTLLFSLIGHTSYVYTLAVLANGNLASGSHDGTVKMARVVADNVLRFEHDVSGTAYCR